MKVKACLFAIMMMVFVIVMGFWSPAHAALTAVGPVDPVKNFPLWYQDTNGLRLGICLDPLFCIGDPVIPGNPTSVAAGFGAEAFYWAAGALIDRTPLTPAILVLALELAWSGGDPAPGTESVFGRVRIRVFGLVPNTAYTITHPFATVDLTSDAVGVINFTDDIGCFGLPVPGGACNFNLPLFSNIGPFLTALAPPPPLGFIGNPGIDQTITGSPTGNNLFRVAGPNAGGPGVNLIETALFAVSGQIVTVPLNVTLAGNGAGTVTDDLLQINCGADCVGSYTPGTIINLTPTPAGPGNVFAGWAGCDTVNPLNNVCTLTVNFPRTVTATFNAPTIAVTPTGDFGNINIDSVAIRTFTVFNGSTVNLNVGTILLAGSAAFTKPVDNCSAQTVLPNSGCTFQIRHLPTVVGNTTGTLTIPSNDPNNPNLAVPLSSFGTQAQAFSDVLGTSLFENHINSMFYNGITLGCVANPPQFCPDEFVTRGQMSAFIIRALEGNPAGTCPAAPFTDVPASDPFCMHITRMAQLGITVGIGGGLFGPDQNVPREQMAAFIVRALEGNPAGVCAAPPFTDVPVTNQFCRHIERAVALGITQGIGGGLFAPSQNVTREQMAAFIARAFLGLP